MKPLKINLLAFDGIIEQSWDIPVLLVFGAMWDRTSRNMFLYLDDIAEKYGDKLRTGMVDYDYVPDIFSDCNVYDIPTLIIYEDGKEYKRITNANSPTDINKLLDNFFGVLPY